MLFSIRVGILRRAIWPKASYGIENTYVSKADLAQLRSRAIKALGLDYGNRSSYILTIAAGPLADPVLFIHWMRTQSFWKFLQINIEQRQVVHLLLASLHLQYPQGPVALFLQSVKFFGFSITAEFVIDFGSTFVKFLDCSLSLLFVMVKQAWLAAAARSMQHRQDTIGITHLHLDLCMNGFKDLDTQQRTILFRCYAGAVQTKSIKTKFMPIEETCDFCTQKESLEHRFFQCRAFQSFRDRHPEH